MRTGESWGCYNFYNPTILHFLSIFCISSSYSSFQHIVTPPLPPILSPLSSSPLVSPSPPTPPLSSTFVCPPSSFTIFYLPLQFNPLLLLALPLPSSSLFPSFTLPPYSPPYLPPLLPSHPPPPPPFFLPILSSILSFAPPWRPYLHPPPPLLGPA